MHNVITEPNDFVAEVHDRLPVVLEAKGFAAWLKEVDDGIWLVSFMHYDLGYICPARRHG